VLTLRLIRLTCRYNRSTRIDFVCPGPDDVDNDLQFAQEAPDCQYQFLWKTQLACDTTPQVNTGSHCQVEDPITGTSLDFSAIGGTSYPVQVAQGGSFYVYVAPLDFVALLLFRVAPPARLHATCRCVFASAHCISPQGVGWE
jgi:hypothetical protein